MFVCFFCLSRTTKQKKNAKEKALCIPEKALGVFSFFARSPYCILPIFVHPLFLVFEPHLQKWVIFVRRRPCVCDTFTLESPLLRGKRSNLAPTPSSLVRTTTIELPECQERRGAKTKKSVIFEKASPAEGQRRLHKNTAYAHLWGFSRPFC